MDAKIIKVGTFDKGGCPIGWRIAPDGETDVLTIKPNGDVLIGGVMMAEMTMERQRIMAEATADFAIKWMSRMECISIAEDYMLTLGEG